MFERVVEQGARDDGYHLLANARIICVAELPEWTIRIPDKRFGIGGKLFSEAAKLPIAARTFLGQDLTEHPVFEEASEQEHAACGCEHKTARNKGVCEQQ